MSTKTKSKPKTNRKLIVRDKDILGGIPVFAGTRVPIKNLFDCLKHNYSIEDFLYDFPTVTREQAKQVLDVAKEVLANEP
jgi:uncharacterized protein (DUF433 family)